MKGNSPARTVISPQKKSCLGKPTIKYLPTPRYKTLSLTKINKIDLTPGVQYVEIPEAELYILCGCPADVVKHMMKRGIIQNREAGGAVFESGPNAILLSDLSLQNGQFSNMAEFPVLQMLYRQGMILPGHPNNRGIKPLLVGSREQIDKQMQYIFRGNYGLISREEILNTGVSEEEADLLMALKLKFAFGKISHPSNLLDQHVIGTGKDELRNGVHIERTETNRFCISYEGESVEVDLALSGDQTYSLPYGLHHHDISREYFGILHSGDGDGWDVHRPSMSSILMFQGNLYLIDAGPNIHHVLNHLGIGINEISGIFHTHSHDDHFAGLTSLMKTDHRIRYFSTPLVRDCVARKLSALLGISRENFQEYFEPVDLNEGTWNKVDGMEVKPIYSPHPVETNIFEFRSLWEGGHMSYAHLADITSRQVLDGMVKEDTPITESYVNEVYNSYHTSHTLKKLDIGGGLIHGEAVDFKGDKSEKIILAHKATPLSPEEKEIGSGAPFGTVDVLINSNSSVLYSKAAHYLNTYFPSAPQHDVNVLLNFPILRFNPESIILKADQPNESILLVLTGNVDMLHTENDFHCVLSSGALLGEFSGMTGINLEETFRALSFVTCLNIPGKIYSDFVRKNDLYGKIEALADKRWLLQRSWLFSESISTPIHNEIADNMVEMTLEAGKVSPFQLKDHLFLIENGECRLEFNGNTFSHLKTGDFLGEEMMFFRMAPILDIVAESNCRGFLVPREAIRKIPIIRFKLKEFSESKTSFLLNANWNSENLTEGNPRLRHSEGGSIYLKLFITNMRILDLIEEGAPLEDLVRLLTFLRTEAEKVFDEELAPAELYACSGKDALKNAQSSKLEEIDSFIRELSSSKDPQCITEALSTWLLDHQEKSTFSLKEELNQKGVY